MTLQESMIVAKYMIKYMTGHHQLDQNHVVSQWHHHKFLTSTRLSLIKVRSWYYPQPRTQTVKLILSFMKTHTFAVAAAALAACRTETTAWIALILYSLVYALVVQPLECWWQISNDCHLTVISGRPQYFSGPT